MLKCSSASFIDSTVDRLFSLEHDPHIWILDRDVATLTLHWVQPYALNNLGRARAYCSSRGSDALFDEVRQKGNLIAA